MMVSSNNTSGSRFPKVDWRVTATTVLCETTGEEVTVMVHGDGTIKCTGQSKLRAGKQKRQRPAGKPQCTGPECPQNAGYRDRLFNEKKD